MNNKSTYKDILRTDEDTVVFEYFKSNRISGSFQSERELENKLIKDLISLGYEYIDFSKFDKSKHKEKLENNLRKQIENLNGINFSDGEWSKLYSSYINKDNMEYLDATKTIQEDYIYTLQLDNGEEKNIYIIDKKNIHNNKLQVINQYVDIDGKHETRYDVTILVNGLPLVQIELKRRGVQLEEAFNQIIRYKETSFTGLFKYIQVFVISNGTKTKYYSNTTRFINIDVNNQSKEVESKASRSFEFTMFWSDQKNQIIEEIEDFTKHFFNKRTLLNILTKYCIFTVDKRLLIMRPYQITATEKIINKIILSNNYKEKLGSKEAGGYIWHTTGSGKTVTSFKTAQIAEELDFVDKILFVVDRKDLDYQTMKEYDKFKKGSANSTSNTKELQYILEKDSKDTKIIITTIQKLSTFVKKNKSHSIYKKHVVLIFDECHRSQFGDMHKAIARSFKKYNIFGFTGTPIFSQNATVRYGNINELKTEIETDKFDITTDRLFGDCLHEYILMHAINDRNVLPFRYHQLNTVREKSIIDDEEIEGIKRKEVICNDQRIANNVKYILDNFNKQTMRDETYEFNSSVNIEEIAKKKKQTIKEKKSLINVKGFNSIFAIKDIELLKKYYIEFKKQLSNRPELDLKIATIYSYSPNEKRKDYDQYVELDDENNESTDKLDKSSRDFLEDAIKDYNEMFGTNYDTSNEKFQNYYRDLSLRVKNKQVDILLVVNMFLTGFDAPTLNTLWVDKPLEMHGLIQAFSRTNRIFNGIKHHGNIVSFWPLKDKLEEAISIYSGGENRRNILIRNFDDYYYGYEDDKNCFIEDGYLKTLKKLKENYGNISHNNFYTEEQKYHFLKVFGKLLKLRNILLSFEEFVGDDIRQISDIEMQDYLGWYQEFYRELRNSHESNETSILDDVVFETELVHQNDINIDYIIEYIYDNREKFKKNDHEIDATLLIMLKSSPTLRSKEILIKSFICAFSEGRIDLEEELDRYDDSLFYKFSQEEFEKELSSVSEKRNLKLDKVKDFFDKCLKIGFLKTNGTDITNLSNKKISRFKKDNNSNTSEYLKNRDDLIEDLKNIYEKYNGII